MDVLKRFVLPVFSPQFYKKSSEKGGKSALKFMLLFFFLVSFLSSGWFFLTTGIGMFRTLNDFEASGFPDEIQVKNGVLTVEGIDMPQEFTEGGQYFAIDTTGILSEIPEGYNEGVLINEESLIVRSKDQYGDTELVYADSVDDFSLTQADFENLIRGIFLILLVVLPVIVFIFTFFFGVLEVLLITVIGAVILSITKNERAFINAFILAVYAAVPVFYVGLVQSLFGAFIPDSMGTLFCCIGIVLWIFKWGAFWNIGALGLRGKSVKVKV